MSWKDDFVDELAGGFYVFAGKVEEEVVGEKGPGLGLFGVQGVLETVVANEKIMEGSRDLVWDRKGREDRACRRGEAGREERVGEDVGDEVEKACRVELV